MIEVQTKENRYDNTTFPLIINAIINLLVDFRTIVSLTSKRTPDMKLVELTIYQIFIFVINLANKEENVATNTAFEQELMAKLDEIKALLLVIDRQDFVSLTTLILEIDIIIKVLPNCIYSHDEVKAAALNLNSSISYWD